MLAPQSPSLRAPTKAGTPATVILSLFPLVACTQQDDEPVGNPEASPTRPNVVLIVVDTLRADRLPFHGGPIENAPFLAELAERSLVFESAWSPSSWTLPATVSVITSVHPFQHGVTSLDGLELEPGDEPVPVNCIPDEVETLAESLNAEGYRTFGIASNILVGEGIGFDRGFDQFVQLPDQDADAVNAQVEAWRSELQSDTPYFLYLHYFDPHDPYHAREPWFDLEHSRGTWTQETSVGGEDLNEWLDWISTRLEPWPEVLKEGRTGDWTPDEIEALLDWIRAAYDSEIAFVDSRIRAVHEMLDLDQSIVVFLADHGEEFYEHGALTHGMNLYGETVRVPLVLSLPGADAPRGRVQSAVSTLDIVPTLRQLLALPASPQDEGLDLLSTEDRAPVLGALQASSGQDTLEQDLHSIVRGDLRLLLGDDGLAELYDLRQDPLERHNIAAERPALVAELRRELEQAEAAAPPFPRSERIPPPPNEALLEHLKGLGYLGDK